MSQKSHKTPDIHYPHHLTPRERAAARIVLISVLAPTLIYGGLQGMKAYGHKQLVRSYVEQPEKMPAGTYDEIVVTPHVHTPTQLADALNDGTHSIQDLVLQIGNQSDHGILHDGDVVKVYKGFEHRPDNSASDN